MATGPCTYQKVGSCARGSIPHYPEADRRLQRCAPRVISASLRRQSDWQTICTSRRHHSHHAKFDRQPLAGVLRSLSIAYKPACGSRSAQAREFRFKKARSETTAPDQFRPNVPGMAALALAGTSETFAIGDCCNSLAVAPTRFSQLLALEVLRAARPTQDRPRDHRPHLADCQEKCAVGHAAYAWRTAQIRVQHCRVLVREVYAAQSSTRRQPVLAHFPHEPDRRSRRHRL